MMRFRILCFSLLLALFLVQGSHARTVVDGDDALLPMDFDQAAQTLETSTREMYVLWAEQVLEFQREHDVAPSELMSELRHSPELQARFMQIEQSSNELRGRAFEAAGSMLDPVYHDRLVAHLESADTLSLMNFLSYAVGMMRPVDGRDDWESSRSSVGDLVKNSRPLQDRLVKLMFDERSVLTLVLAEGEHSRISELFRNSDNWGFQVGQQAVYPAVQLLPQATLASALAQATRPSQLDRLPDYLEELIVGGMLPMSGKLPFEWLVEQVEAGSLIWLNSLAMTEEGVDHPLLYDHFDKLDRSQQLQLIAIRPQPEFLPVLRDTWQEVMDAAWCDGCAEPVDDDLIESLLQVLMAWQTDESAEMLKGVMAMESYAETVETWRFTIGMTALFSESEAFVRLGMDMAQQDVSVPVSPWGLKGLHRIDAGRLKEIVRMRVDHWSDDANHQPFFTGDSQCQRAAVGLYAEGQGLSVDWQQWMPAEAEASDEVYGAGCVMMLAAAALADPDTTAPLLALLTEMKTTGASSDRYDQLTTMVRRSEPTQQQRDLLAAALIDHPAWESLSEDMQGWLLGIETPKKSRLTCDGEALTTEV